jgi:aromatic-L-amino-acid/L-tryptophan decarboxylase
VPLGGARAEALVAPATVLIPLSPHKAAGCAHGPTIGTVTDPDALHRYHMTPDEFRRRGREAVEWVAAYLESLPTMPVRPVIEPGAVRAALPASPPDRPEPFHQVLADLSSVIVPGLVHWQSPDFFAYFPANASGPSVLGDLVSSGLGVQGMLWATSPACTELETHVLDWVVELLGLPDRFRSDGQGGGVIADSASSATLTAVLAARHRAGGTAPDLVGYASREAHSSVEKAFVIAGLGADRLHLVDTDGELAMSPAHLAELIAGDRAAGLRPFFVCATVGTTSTMAFDPVGAITEVAAPEGAWVHVDAAMAGAAGVVPELRWVNDGVDRVDSWCFDPHKWLFTNFDCDCFFVADRAPLIGALSVLPEYLRNEASESGAVIDYRDWQVPLGRRFRALKLWFVIRHYGAEGLRHHLARHVELAERFESWVAADPRFALVAPRRLNLVCLRSVEGDEATQRILDAVNDSGQAFMTHTRVDGHLVIRVSIGQTTTEAANVERAWQLLCDAADGRPLERRSG